MSIFLISISLGINILLIGLLLYWLQKKERQNLIRQLGSQSNALALDARKELMRKRWHLNGQLTSINLQEANLQNADLSKFECSKTTFYAANLQGAILVEANLSDSDLRFADLSGAECRRTNFKGANLRWANLSETMLEGANIEGADLRFANLGKYKVDTSALKGALTHHGLRTEEAQLIHNSSKLIRKSMQAFSQAFYRELFRLHPKVQQLFLLNIKDQASKFAQVFELLVASVDDLDRILPVLKELGYRHRHYGITDWHYEVAGTALLRTIEKSLGPHHNAEIQQAWLKVYQLLVLILQDAKPTSAN